MHGMRRRTQDVSMPRWLYGLLLFSGLAILFAYFPVPPLLLFVLASLGIIPLAALVGQSVERIAEHTGEALGGLLFATFGNATELIIGIFALREGLVDVVRAAIIGAILCNVLLVLGIATCVGSFKHGRLRFERRTASQYASLLALCIAGLVLPAFAELFASHVGNPGRSRSGGVRFCPFSCGGGAGPGARGKCEAQRGNPGSNHIHLCPPEETALASCGGPAGGCHAGRRLALGNPGGNH